MTVAPRTRRSRMLLVGDGKAACLADAMGESGVFAPDPFAAVGEMTHSPAQIPIEFIVVAESIVRGFSKKPAEELRRLDPSVRIGLVRDAHGDYAPSVANAYSDADFDVIFQDWPSVEELDQLLRGDALEQPQPSRSDAADLADGDEWADEAMEASQRAFPSDTEETSLGDVDLVRAVMAGEGAADLAVELIRQHTGWTDIHYHPDAEATGDDGVLLRYDKRTLGSLHSSQAPDRELQRWAEWLAKWLSLDAAHQTYRDLSYRDDLTGAWNRRYFNEFLTKTIQVAAKKRVPVSVMVFDLDDFKKYNDQYGHAAGDEILRETVRMLNSVIRKTDRVCRIGGDEFAVIFADTEGPREKGSMPPETVEQLAQRFQDQVCKMNFPKLGIEAPGTLSVSAGLATFPWDGWEPERILQHADELALQSKRKGKNVLTLGQGAQKVCGLRESKED